jgi:hypothetical protein
MQVGAVVDAIGKRVAQPGKQLVDSLDAQNCTIAILDIGRVYLGTDQQTTSKQAVVAPVIEIALCRGERRKLLRQHSPLTAGARDIQDRIEYAAQLGRARPAQTLGCRHVRLNQCPFRIRQIACVALSLLAHASDE